MHGRVLGFLLFLLPIAAISGGAHWLIASWAMRVFPRLAKYRRAAKIIVAVLVIATPILRGIARKSHSSAASEVLAVLMVEVMLVVLSLPLFLVALLAARVLAKPTPEPVIEEAPEKPADRETTPKEERTPAPVFGRREALERAGGLMALGATSSLLGWGILRGRHAFQIDEFVVKIPGLPKALEGYTIAQVSDLHAGVQVSERDLHEGLDRIAEAKPDLIVVTGDMVDFDPQFAPMLARALGTLKARDGVFAIPGNHDYYAGAKDVLDAVQRAGVEPLVNRGRVIREGDGGGFALLGVDDMWAYRSGGEGPQLEKAIAMVPDDRPRILLAHQPNFVRQAAGKVQLQLSGHTHGGQINPGFTPARLFMPFVAGRYDVEGTVLYVNRGFGVVGPPARVGAPPEVTRVVLVSA